MCNLPYCRGLAAMIWICGSQKLGDWPENSGVRCSRAPTSSCRNCRVGMQRNPRAGAVLKREAKLTSNTRRGYISFWNVELAHLLMILVLLWWLVLANSLRILLKSWWPTKALNLIALHSWWKMTYIRQDMNLKPRPIRSSRTGLPCPRISHPELLTVLIWEWSAKCPITWQYP